MAEPETSIVPKWLIFYFVGEHPFEVDFMFAVTYTRILLLKDDGKFWTTDQPRLIKLVF